MIQANELRLGNWVYDDNITLAKVNGLNPITFDWSVRCDEEEGCELLLDLYRTPYGIKKGMICESTKCEPIPRTPEILEKCGFVNLNYGWTKGDFCLFDFNYGKGNLNLRLNAAECPLPIVKHLHQL